MIEFDERTIRKVKNKEGVYSTLREKTHLQNIEEIEKDLKKAVTDIVEAAFRLYCKAHGASSDIENREWKRFKKYLEKKL